MLKKLFLILPCFMMLTACTNKAAKPGFSDAIIIGKTVVQHAKEEKKPEPHIQISIKGITRLSERIPVADIRSNIASKEKRTDTVLIPKGTLYQFNYRDCKVYINSGSRIIITQSGDTVNLDFCGEAYFITRHDQITINAGNGLQVLADSNSRFTITNYDDFAENPLLKVGLLQGIAIVVGQTDEANRCIFPGQQVQFDRKFPVVSATDLDSTELLAWTAQKFYFDDTDAYTILKKLSRWYNVSLDFSRAQVNDYHFHLIQDFSDPLEEVLNTINGTINKKMFFVKDGKIKLQKS